jgi:SAM-dependent methyltransferase
MSPIISNGAAVVHLAPEKSIKTLLQRAGIQYTSADLHGVDVDLKLNIEHIDVNDGQYDIIVCSHVLEHVNDKATLSELRRILKSDGVLIIMVPILEGCDMTYEDDTITDSKDRLVHFGQDGSCESIRRRFYRQTDWRRLPG